MRVTAALALVAALLGAGAAGAVPTAARGKVAVFPVEGDASLGSRLSAELLAQGFQLEPVASPPTSLDSFEELQQRMQRAGAQLAIRIVIEPASVRLWIVNATTGKQLYREVALAEGRNADSAVVSLWAVEALRASELPRSEQAPISTSESAAPAAPPPAPRLHALQLAPAAVLSPGGAGTTVQVALAGRRRFAGRVGAELLLNVPTLPAEFAHGYGSASLWRGFAAGGLFLTTGGADARTALDVSAGAALLLTHVSGAGNDGFSGRRESLFSFGPYAKVGGSVAVSTRWRLRADAASGVAFPRPVVYFADEAVAAWGRPWFSLSLGTEVSF